MLVISRRLGEQVVIGESIVMTVLEVRGQKIRIGLQAPQQIPIRRNELEPIPLARSSRSGDPLGTRHVS